MRLLPPTIKCLRRNELLGRSRKVNSNKQRAVYRSLIARLRRNYDFAIGESEYFMKKFAKRTLRLLS